MTQPATLVAGRDYPQIITALPGPKGQKVVEQDNTWGSTSYIKVAPLAIKRGVGAMLEDVDGNRFLDFMAGIAVASTGYSHPKVVAAVQEASKHFMHVCGTDYYTESMSALLQKLAEIGPGEGKKRVFLTNSGTEAVEGAIKLVRNSTRRHALIAFHGAFHGRSYGAMSLTSSKAKQRSTFGPMLPGVFHTPYPDPYRMLTPDGMDAGDYAMHLLKTDVLGRRVGAEDVAAVFIEPMLGEGGYVLPPKTFLQDLRALCDETGMLLVFDEIQTGMGRTGEMWAADWYGVAPDVLLTAKGLGSGLPIGAIIARESVMKWPSGSHGSTYGGNPIACAAALATIDIVKDELLPNVRRQGERLMAGLRELQTRHPIIGDVRGTGLFIGIELVKDRTTKAPASAEADRLMDIAYQHGLLLLSCGQSVIRICPPLVVTDEDVDVGLALLDKSLSELTAE